MEDVGDVLGVYSLKTTADTLSKYTASPLPHSSHITMYATHSLTFPPDTRSHPSSFHRILQADATLEMEQRDFARAALEYVCLIQEVQERKKFEFVETVNCLINYSVFRVL